MGWPMWIVRALDDSEEVPFLLHMFADDSNLRIEDTCRIGNLAEISNTGGWQEVYSRSIEGECGLHQAHA